MTRPAAVILAAGRSARMGRCKALLPWGPATLLEAWHAALSAVADPVVVVVGAEAAMIAATAPDLRFVPHPGADEATLRESLLRGLDAAPPDRPALWTPVDVPPPDEAVLHALVAAYDDAEPPFAVLPTHGDRPGHPVLAGPDLVRALFESAPGDRVDELLGWATRRQRRVPVDDPRVLADMNTPADYERWRPR